MKLTFFIRNPLRLRIGTISTNGITTVKYAQNKKRGFCELRTFVSRQLFLWEMRNLAECISASNVNPCRQLNENWLG